MRFRGGYNIKLHGRPGGLLKEAPRPDLLYLPLQTVSFSFSTVCVQSGQKVLLGQVLAKDPDNHDIPMLAPCGGTVDLENTQEHITLKELSAEEAAPYSYHDDQKHIHQKMGLTGMTRYKLLNLGAWEFVRNAHTGRVADPLSMPQAVIVSTMHLEPFLVRGDVLLREHLKQFTRGLEHLQSLLEYQPIYLAFPKITTAFAARIKEKIRGYAWVKLIEVPLTYPYDSFEILARHLGHKKGSEPIWAVDVEGVLAIDKALTTSRPCTERVISIGGPGATETLHLRLKVGHPLTDILDTYAMDNTIAIEGGMLTGQLLKDDNKGISPESRGITFIPELQSREFLGWLRPGFDRRSYSNCFMSSLCRPFPEQLTNAVRGEVRPCVSCGFCEEVCPAGILPHRLHKLIYQGDIDAVEQFRIDLCIECGLCSYVCPSKIELMHQFLEMKETIREEKVAAAVKAARENALESSSESETA